MRSLGFVTIGMLLPYSQILTCALCAHGTQRARTRRCRPSNAVASFLRLALSGLIAPERRPSAVVFFLSYFSHHQECNLSLSSLSKSRVFHANLPGFMMAASVLWVAVTKLREESGSLKCEIERKISNRSLKYGIALCSAINPFFKLVQNEIPLFSIQRNSVMSSLGSNKTNRGKVFRFQNKPRKVFRRGFGVLYISRPVGATFTPFCRHFRLLLRLERTPPAPHSQKRKAPRKPELQQQQQQQ